MGAYPTINLNDDLPAAPANGVNVKFQAVTSTHDDTIENVSAALVGDGNTAHFLRGDGTFAAPSGGTAFHNQISTGALAIEAGVVWINTGSGGSFTVPNGANNGDRLTIVIASDTFGTGLTWTFTITYADNSAYATVSFTSATLIAAGFGSLDMVWGPNGWCIVSLNGDSAL
jgi:hypothetical protein